LPSVAEDEHTKAVLAAASEHPVLMDTAIAITNKNLPNQYGWSASNPLGYAEWFRERNAQAFGLIAPRARLLLMEKHLDLFASVDDVPEQLVRTPLQQAVQVLKRHRDLRFSGHSEEEYKPISMIITTLAGRLYNQEPDVYLALRNIVHRLQHHTGLMEGAMSIQGGVIQRRADGTWYIGNPVNGGENFADRWHLDGNARAEAFFQWVSWVNADLLEITQHQNFNTLADIIEERLLKDPPEKEPAEAPKISMPYIVPATPKPHHVEIREPAKPWSDKA
jgi:hypothetical protein